MPSFIGIDLGTTNTTVSYVELTEAGVSRERGGPDQCSSERLFRVPQFIEPGIIQELPSFPSEAYILTADQLSRTPEKYLFAAISSSRLALGSIARNFRSRFSERVVVSAKSWLAERSVDPRAAILPWGVEELATQERVSPLQVTTELLRQIRFGWDTIFGDTTPFDQQQIVITTPASFDEAALALTREAASEAGYPDSTRLLEEPQAALRAWMGEEYRSKLEQLGIADGGKPYHLLVCDVGGGTTDLSLFEIVRRGAGYQIKRLRVSDHILLGGDNIDLAIALLLEEQIKSSGQNLGASQWRFLLTEARRLKEAVLDESTVESTLTVSLPGAGSSLFAGAISASVTTMELERLILSGFFPACRLQDKPLKSGLALRQSGLHFAHDPAVTKHMAAFLCDLAAEGLSVDGVLFNGGTLRSRKVRERLLQVIGSWQECDANELLGVDVEFAVSRGAALSAFDYFRIGRPLIEGGAARALFLAIAANNDAAVAQQELVCILPRGAVEGEQFVISEPAIAARLDVPVQFRVYGSRESNAKVGELVFYDERSFSPLPPLQTLLRSSAKQERRKSKEIVERVVVSSELDHVGRLRLALRMLEQGRDLGELNFYVRDFASVADSALTERATVFPGVDEASAEVKLFYGKKGEVGAVPRRIFENLESKLKMQRREWPATLCRQLWPAVYPGITRRGRSLEHEVNWLALAGFVLRPGYGVELDNLRIEEVFELYRLGLSFPKEARSQIQYWILWRRIAGGLSAEQQQMIFSLGRSRVAKNGSDIPELYRAVASLERLPESSKLQLLEDLMARLGRRPSSGDVDFISWALMRLLARAPLYASRHLVVPRSAAEDVIEKLMKFELREPLFERLKLPLLSAAQFVGDPAVDISVDRRERVLTRLEQAGVDANQLSQVRVVQSRSEVDEAKLFGEGLPLGLLRHANSISD